MYFSPDCAALLDFPEVVVFANEFAISLISGRWAFILLPLLFFFTLFSPLNLMNVPRQVQKSMCLTDINFIYTRGPSLTYSLTHYDVVSGDIHSLCPQAIGGTLQILSCISRFIFILLGCCIFSFFFF